MDLRLSEVILGPVARPRHHRGPAAGHAERTCLIGMRMADAVGLDRRTLLVALLRAAAQGRRLLLDRGQDRHALRRRRPDVKRDASRPIDVAARRSAGPSAAQRRARTARRCRSARHLRGAGRRGATARASSCAALRARRRHRARDRPREDAAAAIAPLDEHWDGHGHPGGHTRARRSRCSARMLCLAQTVEVFWQQGGAAAACDVARARRGTWFDPALVDALGARARRRFWASLRRARRAALEPADSVLLADDARLDRVAEAFAGVVDAKSPYTARHSAGVAEIAAGIADAGPRRPGRGGLAPRGAPARHRQARRLQPHPRQARHAHREEWAAMRRHPRLSLEILARVAGPSPDVARIAAAHHERLDGKRLPRRSTAARARPADAHPGGRRRGRRAHRRPARTARPWRPTRCWASALRRRHSAWTPVRSRPSSRGCPAAPHSSPPSSERRRGPMSPPPSRSHSLYMSDYRRHAMTHENEDARA